MSTRGISAPHLAITKDASVALSLDRGHQVNLASMGIKLAAFVFARLLSIAVMQPATAFFNSPKLFHWLAGCCRVTSPFKLITQIMEATAMNDMTTVVADSAAQSSHHNELNPSRHISAESTPLATEAFSAPDMLDIQQPEFWLGNGLP